MNSKIITLLDLSRIININKDTLRTWMQGYRFSKFYSKNCVEINKEFVEKLSEFLVLKRKGWKVRQLEEYYKKISCI